PTDVAAQFSTGGRHLARRSGANSRSEQAFWRLALSLPCPGSDGVKPAFQEFKRKEAVMLITKRSRCPLWGRVFVLFALLSLSNVPGAFAQDITKLVFFGDSLSDPGNYFVAFGTIAQQPFGPIPDAPYAIGGHHFTNGATWAEQLARDLHLPTSGSPALRTPGVFTNYAVGRARARARAPVFPQYDLSTQVGVFLSDFGGRAPSDSVYVVWIGANDLDDALN